MRRFLGSITLAFFFIVNTLAAEPVIVNSGNIQVFTEEGVALIKFVYGSAEVNGYPVNEYIENKGGYKYEEKWDKWLKKAERFFVEDFNKRNTGLKLTKNKKNPVKYTITIFLKTLDTGNTFKGFLPTMSFKDKKGSAMMNGTLEVKDKKGNSICVLSLRNIYGTSGLNTPTRLMTLYLEVDKRIRKAVKKATEPDEELYEEENYEENGDETESTETEKKNDIDKEDEYEDEESDEDEDEDEDDEEDDEDED